MLVYKTDIKMEMKLYPTGLNIVTFTTSITIGERFRKLHDLRDNWKDFVLDSVFCSVSNVVTGKEATHFVFALATCVKIHDIDDVSTRMIQQ